MVRPISTEQGYLVADLERICHASEHLEGREFFRQLFRTFPGCSLGKFVDNDTLIAYCIAHPILPNTIPPLGKIIPCELETGLDWFVHDVVVHPDFRGQGLVPMLINESIGLASDLDCKNVSLVAIDGRQEYWKRFGFTTQYDCPDHLGYGRAVSMSKPIPGFE